MMTFSYRNLTQKMKLTTALGICFTGFLSACGTAYKVDHVKTLYQTDNVPGLYYQLPRTNILIEVLVERTKKTPQKFYNGSEDISNGPVVVNGVNGSPFITYQAVFNHNNAICNPDDPDDPIGSPVVLNPNEHFEPLHRDKEIKSTEYALKTVSVPDPGRIYRLDINPSQFASFSHTLEWDESGILKSSNNTIKDGASEFAFNIVKSSVELAATAARFAVLGGPGLSGDDAVAFCGDFNLFKTDSANLSEALTEAKAQKIAFLVKDHSDTSADTLKLQLAVYDARIAAASKARNAHAKKNSLKTERDTFVAVAKVDPPEHANKAAGAIHTEDAIEFDIFKVQYEKNKDDKSPNRIPATRGTEPLTLEPISDAEIADAMTGFKMDISASLRVKNNPAHVHISAGTASTNPPTPATSVPSKKAKKKKINDNGYKYRIPAHADIVLKRTKKFSIDKDGNWTSQTLPKGVPVATAGGMPIAQFGPIVSLPSKFKGSSGTLNLAYFASTGGLSTATIGGEPISATAVSQYIDVAKGYQEGKNAAELAAQAQAEAEAEKLKAEQLAAEEKTKADAKAEASAENDALTILKNKLQLEKDIRELREQAATENDK